MRNKMYARVGDCGWVDLRERSEHGAKVIASRIFGWLGVDIEVGMFDPDSGKIEPIMVRCVSEGWVYPEC